MYTIIQLENGAFQVKDLDKDGNPNQNLPQQFATEADAQEYINEIELKRVTPENAAPVVELPREIPEQN